MTVPMELLERVLNLKGEKQDKLYRMLGMDTFLHFRMNDTYRESYFVERLQHLLDEIERGENQHGPSSN